MIGPTLIGKRINVAGDAGTVVKENDRTYVIRLDRWKAPAVVLKKYVANAPNLIARDSFLWHPDERK